MHIPPKPGEQIEVYWAGQTATIINDETGEIIPDYVFVSALAYSQYAYLEAFLARDQECWNLALNKAGSHNRNGGSAVSGTLAHCYPELRLRRTGVRIPRAPKRCLL